MENFLPYVTRKVFTQARRMTSADDKDLGASDREEEKHYLERVREESELPEYDLYADYAEMVVQVPPPSKHACTPIHQPCMFGAYDSSDMWRFGR